MQKRGRTQKRNCCGEITTIAAVLTALVMLTIIAQLHGNPVTGHAVQTIGYAKADSELFFEIRNLEPLKDANINFTDNVKNAIISFEEIKKVSWPFDGVRLLEFKIESPDQAKFRNVQLRFKVSETDIKEKATRKEWIKLYFDGQPLETTIVKQEKGYVWYSVDVKQFGEFLLGTEAETAIVAPEKVETEPATASEEKIPLAEQPTTQPQVEQPTPITPQPNFFSKVKEWFLNLFG